MAIDKIQFYNNNDNNENDDDDGETKLSFSEHLSDKCRQKTILE